METFNAVFKNPRLIQELYDKTSSPLTSHLSYYCYNNDKLKKLLIHKLKDNQINFCIGIQPQVRNCYSEEDMRRIHRMYKIPLNEDGSVRGDILGENVKYFFFKILKKMGEFAIVLNSCFRLVKKEDYPDGITCDNIEHAIIGSAVVNTKTPSSCAISGGKKTRRRRSRKGRGGGTTRGLEVGRSRFMDIN